MDAEPLPWWIKGCSGRRNEGTVLATVIAQWTLLVGQRKHNGTTREAEASLKLIHNVYNRVHFLYGRPLHTFCDRGDLRAFFLPPMSNM